MKITAFREAFREPGVTLLESVETELSFERVVRERLGSLRPLWSSSLPGLSRVEPLWQLGAERERHDEEVVFRAPDGGERSLRALFCADSPDRLAEFVLGRCQPACPSSSFAQLVARARDKKGVQARRLFARELNEGNERARSFTGGYFGPYPGYAGGADVPLSDPRYPFVTSVELERNFASISAKDGDVRVPRAGPGTVLSCPGTIPVSGRQIPRLAFVIPLAGRDGSGAVVFDSHTFCRVRSLGEIPDSLARAFEVRGTVSCRSEIDVLPNPHLRARTLVRVPAASEVSRRRPSRKLPRIPEVASPAYVFDSRVPVHLVGDEPILDDPGIAAAILSRTSSGIFLPAEVPTRDPIGDRLREHESWLVLAEVGAPL